MNRPLDLLAAADHAGYMGLLAAMKAGDARLLEIPTPRWTAFDAAFFQTRMPPEVPLTTEERAYSSPIWYVP